MPALLLLGNCDQYPQWECMRVSTQFCVWIVHETEVDVFLEFLCFLHDPGTIGNLISGSSSFSKPNMDIWKSLVHIMLKPIMQDFKHDLTSMSATSQWLTHSLVLTFLEVGMRIDLFQSCGHCWVFQIC